MVQGVLIPIRYNSGRYNQSLTFNLYIEAYKITRQKKKYVEMNISEEQIAKI